MSDTRCACTGHREVYGCFLDEIGRGESDVAPVLTSYKASIAQSKTS